MRLKLYSLPQRFFFTIICTCIIYGVAHSQASLSGRVVLADERPAEFNNVILLSLPDSQAVKLELTDETGRYELPQIDPGTYFIRVSGLDIADTETASFQLADGEKREQPTIYVEQTGNTLQTVEVTERRPLLEQKAGRLVVNVDQSITGQGGSVVDLLKKVPGVIVVGNQIRMAGREGVTILIDGRPTRYMDIESLLREMPAENIARIEVISQPGASYDAEGTGGIINIILKKNVLLGTNGNITVGSGYGERAKYQASANVNHRSGPWNLSAGAAYNHRSWVEGLDLVRRLPDSSFIQSNNDVGLPHSYSVRLGADYDINDAQRIGLNGRWQRSETDISGENYTRIEGPGGELLQEFTTFNNLDRFWRSWSTDGYYRWKIDTSGQQLSADMSYSNYRREATRLLRTEGANFDTRRNLEPASTELLVAQVDYKNPLSKQWRFEAGAKISVANLDNELDSRVLTNEEWVIDRGLSNRFLYDEYIRAAYTSFLYERDGLEATLGLRFEDTETDGYSVTLDSTIQRNFSQLFPSLSVSLPIAGPLGLSAAYSYRIERPSYYDLNPFVAYLDPFTFQAGNPFLRPELTHSGQLSVTYEKQPFLNLSYDYTSDVMADVTEQDDASGAAFATTVNLDRYIRYGGSLFFPLDFIAKAVGGYGGVMVYYHDYSSDYLGGEFNGDTWSITGFMNLTASLPAEWKMEVTGWYQGAGLDGIMAYQPLYGVNVGLEKKFADNQWRLQLSGDGIIQQFWRGRVDYQNMDFDILSTWEAPVFYARLTYNFGNRFLKKENRNSAAEEARRRINLDE